MLAERAELLTEEGDTQQEVPLSQQTEAKDTEDDSHRPQSYEGPDNVISYPLQVTTHRRDSTEGIDALPSVCNKYYTATCYKQVS